jgi:hypothetical protein
MADIRIQNEGTIFLFTPISDEAIEWWETHVEEGMTYCGANVVEHRPAAAIIDGLIEAGFEIEGI